MRYKGQKQEHGLSLTPSRPDPNHASAAWGASPVAVQKPLPTGAMPASRQITLNSASQLKAT